MAINHYIEAQANGKAIEACMNARQWTKAVLFCCVATTATSGANLPTRVIIRYGAMTACG